jgi:hypothetical protein
MTTDQGAARGQIPYEPGRCECTHLVTFHVINGKGRRAKCSRSDCTCRQFVAEEAAS